MIEKPRIPGLFLNRSESCVARLRSLFKSALLSVGADLETFNMAF